jgi:transcriptional regulator with XRE-family HTH domain
MKKVIKERPSLAQIVGGNVRAARKIKGWTQSDLAQELGVETETVSRYERGLLAPSFPQLEKLCNALDVPAWMLFSDGDGTPDARAMTIVELLKGLSARDVEYVVSSINLYAEHHRHR